MTLALIPGTPHAKKIAGLAKEQGFELMLHVPMETIHERRWENGLTDDMEKEQLQATIDEMIQRYPDAKGINNHGGSLLTQQREKMDWLMSTLVKANMYFVDSRTIATSVAGKAANDAGLTPLIRDVFLDNDRTHSAIELELENLKKIALKRGQAIGIAHPYQETIDVLEKYLPKIVEAGFQLVFVSDLLANEENQLSYLESSE